jgi:hypothetical protein
VGSERAEGGASSGMGMAGFSHTLGGRDERFCHQEAMSVVPGYVATMCRSPEGRFGEGFQQSCLHGLGVKFDGRG